jgi:hypothetical protein
VAIRTKIVSDLQRRRTGVNNLSFGGQLIFVALGVMASALIPVLVAAWPKAAGVQSPARIWNIAKPYVALAIGSLLIAVVVLAAARSQNKELKEWWQAMLAGYAFDSTLQKLRASKERGALAPKGGNP